jgi:hypothetical protein
MAWDGTKIDNTPSDTTNGILNASDWNDLVTNVKARILHSLSTAENDVLVGSGSNSFIKKTLTEFKTILGLGDAAYKNTGTSSGTLAAGDDSRLSNSREPTSHNSTHFPTGSDPITITDIGAAPTSHNHAESDITNLTTDLSNKSDINHNHSGIYEPVITKNSAFNVNFGTTTGTATQGDDSRLSNNRYPTSHNSSHFPTGSDPISASDIGAAPSSHTHSESDITNLVTDLSNKEPTITKLTAFNKNYETSTDNIKMNGSVSIGSLDTLAHSDHVHPVDTSRAPSSHNHTQSESHNSPDTDVATTSLHHTIGTGANQSAAGNHNHSGVYEPSNSNIQFHISSTSNPHSTTYTQIGAEPANTNIQSHISSTSNPHGVTATQVGLSNVLNLAQLPATYLDTSTALGTSDTKVPSQNAVKVYSDVYAPKLRTFFVPSYLYSSGNVEKSIKSTNGYHFQNSPATGDYFYVEVFCSGSETILDVSWYKDANRCIFDIYVNGVLDSSSYDGYASSPTVLLTSITLLSSVRSGWNEIKFLVNGKNASSSNYILSLYGVRLR